MVSVHDFGALLFFVCGVVYAILQSVISYRGRPYGSSKAVCHVRAVFATVAFLAVFPSILSQYIKHIKIHMNQNSTTLASPYVL